MQKVLFDTSCVFPILAPTLEPYVYTQLPKPSYDCKYYTGHYLRMEFFRRWIITGIEIYFHARSIKSLPQTCTYFSHTFSTRDVKACLLWLSKYTESISENPTNEQVERFGWEVYKVATSYDIIFQNLVSSKTSCSKGKVTFNDKASTLTEVLREFHTIFKSDDHSCRLARLLDIENNSPKLRPILKANTKDCPQPSRKSFKKLKEKLEKIMTDNKPLDCKICYKIGDILITLEQPPKHILYHTDKSFLALCYLLKRKNHLVESSLKATPKIPIIEFKAVAKKKAKKKAKKQKR